MPQLPEVRSADRFYPFAEGQSVPPVAAPLPIRVPTDGGATIEFPAGTSQEIVAQTMQRHAGGARQTSGALRAGMFDDLIPQQPPVARAGMFDDLIPVAPAGSGPRLIPVDHDPFAGTARQTPRLIPVDHDPFAGAARVPRPGMFDDLIPQAAPAAPADPWDQFADAPRAAPAADPWAAFADAPPQGMTPGGVPIGESGRPRVRIGNTPEPTGLQRVHEAIDPVNVATSAYNALSNGGHSLRVGAQGVGAGLRDIALAPFDLAAGATNLVAGGVNKLFGTEIPAATPASQLLDPYTAPLGIPEREMSPGEKLGYNINRFGTQALGSGAALATRAPAVAAATMPSKDPWVRTLDALARPYMAAPARTVTGDAIGGMGAGAAVSAANEYLPKEPATTTGQILKGTANFLAPLAGGIGANTAQSVVEGLGGMLKGIAKRSFVSSPHEIPLNPRTREPFSTADIDRAARELQSKASSPPVALAQDIRENASELANPVRPGETPVAPSQMPTSGLLSRDPGLVTAEGAARTRNPSQFIERDQNVKEAAGQRVDSLRDEGADLSSVVRRAGEARNERLAPTEQRVQQVEDLSNRVEQQRMQQGAEFGAVNNSAAKANASQRLDTNLVEQNYIPARAEKNRQFDEAPGRTQQLPADDVFAAIDRVRAGVNQLGPNSQMPGELMQRLDRLRPQLDDAGNNIGGSGTAAGGDLADLRKYLNTAQESAQRGGNFDLADNIGALRRSINQTIGDAPGYAEANANYSQFANRFRPERNDEMAKFTREIDRGGQQPDGALNRGSTPPSETASRFLSSPEKSQALQRVLADAPNAAAGQSAVRDYMRSDFASAAMNTDGTLNPARAAAWGRNNADVLAQFPALRTEFDGYARSAQRGGEMSTEMQTALKEARAARKGAEAEIDRGAIGTLLKEDPRDVASKLLNGGYGAEKRATEIAALVKNDADAARGWKAAVAEVLTDKVTSTRTVGETKEVQFARLAKEFTNNEALLAKTFAPDEMNTLRQGHTLLEYFKEAEKRATTGSNTADKTSSLIPGWVQLGVRHAYGDLKGGGIIKRFKLLLEQLPTNKQSTDELVNMAWFDPSVAAYLLDKPVKNANAPQYNIALRRAMAAANALRESGE